MAERDRFELDLAAALRAYLEEAPTEVRPTELARQFATTYPRRRVALGRWDFGPTPAIAWILLAVGLLLVALVGGALLVGSQMQRRLPPRVAISMGPVATCPPGSNPDQPGPADQRVPPAGGSSAAFDRRAGKLIYLGANTDGPQETWTVETWTFDVCTNTWTRMHPDREPPALVSGLVYDDDSDVTIGVQYKDWTNPEVIGNVWAYDLETNTWTEHGAAPMRDPRFYDPVSGLVVADDWTYDVETDSWTAARHPMGCGTCAYDLSVDRVIGYGSPLEDGALETWLLDLRTGAWSKSGAETPDCTMHAWALPAIVYDEAAQRTVVAGADRWGAYDAAADRWEILFEFDRENRPDGPAVYDPTNRRLIVFGDGIGVDGDAVAYDLVTREWTVLLEPFTGQATP